MSEETPAEPAGSEPAPEPTVAELLADLAVMRAVVAHYITEVEDIDAHLDEHVAYRRDGTVIYTPPETSEATGEAADETATQPATEPQPRKFAPPQRITNQQTDTKPPPLDYDAVLEEIETWANTPIA